MKNVLLAILLGVVSTVASAVGCEKPIKLTSWNIRDLGQSKNDAEIAVIAKILANSDIVAVQEVVAGSGGPDAVDKLLVALQKENKDWMAVTSDKTTGVGTERYTYFWRYSKVDRVDTPENGLSAVLSDNVDREPYLQTFYIGGERIAIASFHAVPKNKGPEKEIVQLPTLFPLVKDARAIVLGDFNLGFDHEAFDTLRSIGMKSHIRGKTSLKMKRKDGEHLNHPYDNVFTEHVEVCDAGIIDFTSSYETLKDARYISDHLPVWIHLGG
ncbi:MULTISPECIES: endonuclease/exonuclease/phosphatase family protein [unclassified Agarivorans]|uniref:endonuclease/exonuclease/phosphatase family protein n=1 Tax=unclassified Agarivorans TaxID=2636026 RepID=UPI0026E46EB1|nr:MULTISPECIES: endonuclease/exonuclease/phosphatase family protein [unclassified Agarivorans]MDO6686644.1 endonuclease/exonuclease/phosphatase family protein [Agarivorans sp. 3_MG-2023]MDO6717741.1 endonuclease/exonuclease/phosphatase family protein [Agarivorans sp. 2_MG-2023]